MVAIPPEELDASLRAFLDFIERDIEANPERLQTIPTTLVNALRELVAGVEIDIEKPIEGPVAL